MTRELKGAYATDTSILIELVYGTPLGETLRDAILEEAVEVIAHELAIAELRYVLCRKIGKEKAKARVEKLLASGYIMVEDSSELIETAADYKCERAISLPDCFTLSLGKERSLPVLFAGREKELAAEMESKPFNVEILFLENYTSTKQPN
jgi:predicted nucleic acid-binding protein